MAKYCSHCGKQINDTAAFCKYCGKKVDSELEIKEVPEIVNKKTAKEPISPSSDEKLPINCII